MCFKKCLHFNLFCVFMFWNECLHFKMTLYVIYRSILIYFMLIMCFRKSICILRWFCMHSESPCWILYKGARHWLQKKVPVCGKSARYQETKARKHARHEQNKWAGTTNKIIRKPKRAALSVGVPFGIACWPFLVNVSVHLSCCHLKWWAWSNLDTVFQSWLEALQLC